MLHVTPYPLEPTLSSMRDAAPIPLLVDDLIGGMAKGEQFSYIYSDGIPKARQASKPAFSAGAGGHLYVSGTLMRFEVDMHYISLYSLL